MGSMQVTPLDMAAIQKLTNNLYAINNSNLGRTMPQGVVHLLVTDSSGQEVTINIPKTWIPTNLGDYCDVPAITKSSKFRELVRKRILIIISDEEAEALLSSSPGRAESENVSKKQHELNQAMKQSFAPQDTRVSKHGDASSGAPPQFTNTSNSEPVIDGQVRDIIAQYKQGMSDTDCVEAITHIVGDKESWIWASQQVADTSSATYMIIMDKISEAEDGAPTGNAPRAPEVVPGDKFTINIG